MYNIRNYKDVLGSSADSSQQFACLLSIKGGYDLSDYLSRSFSGRHMFEVMRGLEHGVPEEVLESTFLSESSLGKLVDLHISNYDVLNQFGEYLDYPLSNEHWEYIIKWVTVLVDISAFDIVNVPINRLKVLDYGIKQGLDVTVFAKLPVDTPYNYIKYLIDMKIMGFDISLFMEKGFNIDVLGVMCTLCISNKLVARRVLPHISSEMISSEVYELIECATLGMDITEIAKSDEEGYPLYSLAHMSIIRSAYTEGYDYERLYLSEEVGIYGVDAKLHEVLSELRGNDKSIRVLRDFDMD